MENGGQNEIDHDRRKDEEIHFHGEQNQIYAEDSEGGDPGRVQDFRDSEFRGGCEVLDTGIAEYGEDETEERGDDAAE